MGDWPPWTIHNIFTPFFISILKGLCRHPKNNGFLHVLVQNRLVMCLCVSCSSYSHFYSRSGVHSRTIESKAKVEQVRLRLQREIASRARRPQTEGSQGEEDAFWQSLHIPMIAEAGFAMLVCKALVSCQTRTDDMGGWHLPCTSPMTWKNSHHVVPYLMIHYSWVAIQLPLGSSYYSVAGDLLLHLWFQTEAQE